MVKTHEINLNTSVFNQLEKNNYIILENNNINKNDFILFHQVEMIDGEISDTGLYNLVQVIDVINDKGLKEDYVLIITKKH